MKKLVTLILATLFIVSTLAGCTKEAVKLDEKGNVTNPESVKAGKNELILWTLFGGGDGEFMEQMIAKYNDTNPKYKVRSVKLKWGEYYTKLMTAVAANKGPDIGISHTSKLPELVEQGVVAPMDEFGQEINWSSFNTNIMSASTFDGQKYAIPIDTHAQVLYYNKALVREAGLLNDDGTITIANEPDGLKNFLHKLKSNLPEDIAPLSFSQKGDDPWRFWWIYYFQMGGTPLMSENGKTVTMDVDKAVQAAEHVKSLYDEGLVPPNIEDFYKHFQGGNGALFSSGVWCTGIFEKDENFDFGVMPLPKEFEKAANWGDSHTFVLPVKKKRNDDKSKAALEFMEFITKEGVTWAKAGHIPANVDVVNSNAFKELPYRLSYSDVADTVIHFGNSSSNWPIKSEMISNLNLYWASEITSQEAIQNIVDEMESTIN